MNAMEDKMENHESQVGGNRLTLSDPLSKPKKWAVGLIVCIMILMMLAASSLSPSDSAAANTAGSIAAVPTT